MFKIDNMKKLKQDRLIPKAKKRKVYLSDSFQCPYEFIDGWETFKQVVVNGEDLKPYLSRGVKNLKDDYMLYSWGVYHFHLGDKIERDGFVTRTKPVLIAYITEDAFYVVGLFNHGKDVDLLPWDNIEIVDIIHRNWSYLISRYKIVGIKGVVLAPKERAELRKIRGNTTVTVCDGTVYRMIGGGIMPNGDNIFDVIKIDFEIWKKNLKEYS